MGNSLRHSPFDGHRLPTARPLPGAERQRLFARSGGEPFRKGKDVLGWTDFFGAQGEQFVAAIAQRLASRPVDVGKRHRMGIDTKDHIGKKVEGPPRIDLRYVWCADRHYRLC